jgi:hypothetical protein
MDHNNEIGGLIVDQNDNIEGLIMEQDDTLDNGEELGFVSYSPVEISDWKCHLFGVYDLTIQPRKGDEPNWFWRKMQYLLIGNKWVKESNDE